MKKLLLMLILSPLFNLLSAQEEAPIWDIGTKWTYSLYNSSAETAIDKYGYLTNEIIDTITLDGLKLYEVESYPRESYINYFHYQGSKVYNYDPETQVLQLLYDFEETEGYSINYRPLCDPEFDYDSLHTQEYSVTIDSMSSITTLDGTILQVQHVKERPIYSPIIKNVGFASGYIRATHDWFIGDAVCCFFSDLVGPLRCFESETEYYQFVDYPCDLMGPPNQDTNNTLANTTDLILLDQMEIFPNPTTGAVQIRSVSEPIQYELYNSQGIRFESGIYEGGNLQLDHPGLNLLQLFQGDQSKVFKILKTE